MLSCFSAAISWAPRPSQEPSTSSLCCPNSGEGLTRGGVPSNRTGQAGIITLPVVGCSITCMMPRASSEGSFISSSVSNTAPAGTPAAPMIFIASSLVCWRVQVAISSSTSAARWLRASCGLRDHVEGQALLIRAAGSETLDLAVDDAGVELLDLVIAEAQPLDRTGRHVLDCHIRLLQQLPDNFEPARRFQIQRQRFLV